MFSYSIETICRETVDLKEILAEIPNPQYSDFGQGISFL